MELEKSKYKMVCELGACGRRADYSIRFARTGTKSNLNVCSECLKELARLAEQVNAAPADRTRSDARRKRGERE